jgi:hypothetical protein
VIFTTSDYTSLSALVFRSDYPGNATARGVVESPHGDGQLDAQKRYAHVAAKYIEQLPAGPQFSNSFGYQYQTNFWCGPPLSILRITLEHAATRAYQIALELHISPAFTPSYSHSALRILEYSAGVGGHEHTDFSLLTVNCYRNVPNPGLPDVEVHIGELGELLGLGPAMPHRVDPLPVVQQSIVYFAVPDHSARLPSGESVGEWIAERKERSRYVREV